MRLVLAVLLTLLSLPSAHAEEILHTRYAITLIGLPVGQAEFETRLSSARYAVSGTLRSAGLAELVSETRGTSSTSGRIRADRVEAERYRLAYTSDGKSWSSDVRYRNGRAVSAAVAPPIRSPAPADFVPVRPAQLARVVDPLGGLMIKASREDLCRRTLPVYDGWTRLDLALSPGGTERFEADGFEGDAAVCDARIRPIGGYRTSSNGLKYLRDKTIRIAFAPVGDTGIWAPVRVRIPTQVGPLSLTATTFAKP